MLSATRDLLISLDPLSHRERLRYLAEWARATPDRAAVCTDLRGLGGADDREVRRSAFQRLGGWARRARPE